MLKLSRGICQGQEIGNHGYGKRERGSECWFVFVKFFHVGIQGAWNIARVKVIELGGGRGTGKGKENVTNFTKWLQSKLQFYLVYLFFFLSISPPPPPPPPPPPSTPQMKYFYLWTCFPANLPIIQLSSNYPPFINPLNLGQSHQETVVSYSTKCSFCWN